MTNIENDDGKGKPQEWPAEPRGRSTDTPDLEDAIAVAGAQSGAGNSVSDQAYRQPPGVAASSATEHVAIQFLRALDPNAKAFTFQMFDDNEERKKRLDAEWKVKLDEKKATLTPEQWKKYNRRRFDPYVKIVSNSWSEVASLLKTLNEQKAGIYVTVNETNLKGRSKKHIKRIRAVFCEYDRKDGAIDLNLETILRGFPLKPTIVVESSPGKYHFYWCVSDDWPVSTTRVDGNDNDLDFSNVMACMVEKYGSDKACTDQSRVLRIPGYNHNKKEPHFVNSIYSNGPRYTKAEITDNFKPSTKTNQEKTTKYTKKHSKTDKFEQRWYHKALQIELNYLDGTEEGTRNDSLNGVAFRVAQIAAISDLDLVDAEAKIREIARERLELGENEIATTIASGFNKGKEVQAIWPYWVEKIKKNRLEFDVPDVRSKFNVAALLDWAGIKLSWNDFCHRIEISGFEEFNELNDNAESRIWDLAHNIGFRIEKPFLYNCVNAIALYDTYHPVIDRFDQLTWDKTPRLDKILTAYCGVEDNEYTRCVGAKTMIAMVRRIRVPGTKFDQMLVLEGPQGIGKSGLLRVLALQAEWFTDDMAMTLQSKEINEKTEGIMLAEVPELQKMRAADLEQVKAMMSRQVDRARPAYGRRAQSVQRQFIMWGTVNIEQDNALGVQCAYLKDPTGNRRFWPIRCSGKVKLTELQADIEQIWAEAVERERNGESIEMPEVLWKFAEKEQSARMEIDPWIEILSNEFGEKKGKILTQDVWVILGIKLGQVTKSLEGRLGRVMLKLGWEHTRLRQDKTMKYHYAKGSQPYAKINVSIQDGIVKITNLPDQCTCERGGAESGEVCKKCGKMGSRY